MSGASPRTEDAQPNTVKRAAPSAVYATTFSQIRTKASPHQTARRNQRPAATNRPAYASAASDAASSVAQATSAAPATSAEAIERQRGQRDDDADRGEHGGRGKLPARHGLEPQVDEQPVLHEVADRRGAEPERRERDEDPEPVAETASAAACAGLASQRANTPITTESAPSAPMPSRRGTVICVRSSSR